MWTSWCAESFDQVIMWGPCKPPPHVMTIKDPSMTGHYTVNFGKHRGKEFRGVYRADPGYCAFVLTLEPRTASMGALQAYIRWEDQLKARKAEYWARLNAEADVLRAAGIEEVDSCDCAWPGCSHDPQPRGMASLHLTQTPA